MKKRKKMITRSLLTFLGIVLSSCGALAAQEATSANELEPLLGDLGAERRVMVVLATPAQALEILHGPGDGVAAEVMFGPAEDLPWTQRLGIAHTLLGFVEPLGVFFPRQLSVGPQTWRQNDSAPGVLCKLERPSQENLKFAICDEDQVAEAAALPLGDFQSYYHAKMLSGRLLIKKMEFCSADCPRPEPHVPEAIVLRIIVDGSIIYTAPGI